MLLTDPVFIRRLESLYLLARKVLGGTLQADRKSTRKGAGITLPTTVSIPSATTTPSTGGSTRVSIR